MKLPWLWRDRLGYVCLAWAALTITSCGQSSIGRAENPAANSAASQDDSQPASNKAKKEKHHPANRLAKETSPYLLQHAHNPVDWRPWGVEALSKAKTENKPIFLSVGYSSCHWCHVMERESFEDEEIAAFLNKHYVCIKVDREERPDIDGIYMTAVQILTRGSGGWPMSVFLTPAGEPFFGGTYFPARDGDRNSPIGFLTIVKKLHEAWTQDRKLVESEAVKVARLIKLELEARRVQSLKPLDAKVRQTLLTALQKEFDPVYGGFGYATDNPRRPKFPEPSNLFFLLQVLQKKSVSGEKLKDVEHMIIHTLDRMLQGGIYDHVGGGFHRYSVDRYWRIPHFEKMLYDNGQLATVYSEAFRLTGRQSYRRTAEGILDFVLREMTDEQGGFYSALDADSEGEEGKFYRWTMEEIETTLSKEERELFSAVYGLDEAPNFEEKYYVPQLAKPLAEIAKDQGVAENELERRLQPIRAKLLKARSARIRPLTDTKILTSWNGLMIRGFADAGRIFDNSRYTAAARRAAEFCLRNLRDETGRLRRTHSRGEARLNAYLNDYAYLANGLIALHRATGERKWLDAARQITKLQIELFWDKEHDGFYFTSDDHESLLARDKRSVDGAQPSGSSVAVENLEYLGRILKSQDYIEMGRKTVQSNSGLMTQFPNAAPRMTAALLQLLQKP